MAVVEVVFRNHLNQETLPILYQVYDIPPAQRWLGYLEILLRLDSPLERHILLDRKVGGRFVGFPNTGRDAHQISKLINDCINAINDYAPGTIDLKASPDMSQDTLNALHKYFEIYRGPVLKPHPIYEKGPDEVKKALEDFNIFIHEFEDLQAANQMRVDGKSAQVDLVFLGRRTRYELYPEDYKFFQPHRNFGGLYAHYCEVGKQFLDVYRDRDEIVAEDNIRPLKYLSGDFDINFGLQPNPEHSFYQSRDFQDWLLERGYFPWDKTLSQGYLELGKMIKDDRFDSLTQPQFIELLGNYLDVKMVKVHR